MHNHTHCGVLSIPAFVCGLIVFSGSGVMAATVYKWTDTAGVMHFSEDPPSQDVESVERLEFDALTVPPPGVNDYYSIVNQARRMEAARRKREQEDLDRRLAIRRAEQAEREESESYRSDTRYIPVYTYYGYRHPYRTGYYRGKPGSGLYPGYRPGFGKHPRPVPYRDTRARHYPRGVISTGRSGR